MNNGRLKKFLKDIKINEPTISMVLGLLVIVVIGVLIYNYFRGIGGTQKTDVLPTQEVKENNGQVEIVEESGKKFPENLPAKHQVAKSESLWAIAEKYYGSGYNWVDIAKANNLKNPNILTANQELTIPKTAIIEPIARADAKTETKVLSQTTAEEQYTVVKGDNLWRIASKAYGDGYKWVEIARANKLAQPGLIHPGNVLTLPR